jgi:hypothetical protein
MSNTAKVSKVDAILAARAKRAKESKLVVTEEIKLKWKEQEPTDVQVKFLTGKVSDTDLMQMSKYDASERIENILVEWERKGNEPASEAQIKGLLAWDCSYEDIHGITKKEANLLFYKLGGNRNRK